MIRADPLLVKNSISLPSLSSGLMEEIISDKEMKADESTLFCIIQEWLESYASSIMKPDDEQIERRRDSAKKLATYIRLEDIDAHYLCTVVSSSGLVSEDRINEAYKIQALKAASSSKRELSAGKPRSTAPQGEIQKREGPDENSSRSAAVSSHNARANE
jgi:hypothetical protein